MPLGALLSLYRQRLRARVVQELLAVLGIAVGVALVFAALVAATSLSGSVEQLTRGVVGDARLQVSAKSPSGLDERLVDRVAALDGVEGAAPLLEARANLRRGEKRVSVMLVGGDPKFARFGGALVRQFTADGLSDKQAIALPKPIADQLGIGFYEPVDVDTGAGTTRLPVAARLTAEEIGPLVHSPVAVAPLRAAQAAAGMPGRVTRIFVRPVEGQDAQVRAALEQLLGDRATVTDADHEVALFDEASIPTNQSTTMFSALAALVGFLFALAAVLLALPQRRAYIRLLHRAGAGRRAIAGVLLVDALVLGVVGAAGGLLLGDQLSRHVYGGVPGYLATGFPIGDQRIVTPAAVAAATAAGILAAAIAVLAPLRVDAARSAASPRRRQLLSSSGAALAGGAGLIAAVAIVALAPSAAVVGLIALTGSLLLLLPSILRGGVAAVDVPTRRERTGALALALLVLRPGVRNVRAVTLAATGAIAVFATIAIGGAHADLVRGLQGSARDVDDNADIWVTFAGTTSPFATVPFDATPSVIEQLRATPGVAAVRSYGGTFADVDDLRAWVQAPPSSAPAPIPPRQVLAGDLREATDEIRAGGAVALSRVIADQLDVDVGDDVDLPAAGPGRYRVAAIVNNLGWPTGTIILNADDYARTWQTTAPSALQLQLDAGADPQRAAAAVRETLADDTVTVETRAERIAAHADAVDQGLVRLRQIRWLVLFAAILAMATATAASIWQRRPSLAYLRTQGTSARTLWRSLLIEHAVLLGLGCLAGAVTGLVGQALLTRALENITGFPVAYATAAAGAVGALTLVLAGALSIIAIPGWLATRTSRTPQPST